MPCVPEVPRGTESGSVVFCSVLTVNKPCVDFCTFPTPPLILPQSCHPNNLFIQPYEITLFFGKKKKMVEC